MGRTNGQKNVSMPLAGYMTWHQDQGLSLTEPGSIQYFGFINDDGAWYIQRIQGDDIDFSAGIVNAETNWGNRASLSYDTFDNTAFPKTSGT